MKMPSQYIVVDDDAINNMVCKYTIARFAPMASIELFTDPEKALTWIVQEYSHRNIGATVLFLDINMQTMSGWEFLDEFSSLPEHVRMQIKVFMLSSSIDIEDKQMADNHPLVYGFYSKPLSRDTLILIGQKQYG